MCVPAWLKYVFWGVGGGGYGVEVGGQIAGKIIIQ